MRHMINDLSCHKCVSELENWIVFLEFVGWYRSLLGICCFRLLNIRYFLIVQNFKNWMSDK